MQEKEVIIPIRFPITVGKTRMGDDGQCYATISIKTKLPIILAYFSLTLSVFMLAIKRIWA